MQIAFVGSRGMVGSVLYNRMVEMGNFDPAIDWSFFSSSQNGKIGPLGSIYKDSRNPKLFNGYDVIMTCQGGAWTDQMYPEIIKNGWKGIWLDASSSLRMQGTIVLDPINKDQIIHKLGAGEKIFTGGNCTVSLMLMAIQGLFAYDLVEWINAETYQAASGAGAKYLSELLEQIQKIGRYTPIYDDVLFTERCVSKIMKSDEYPIDRFGTSLANNLIPWIDSDADHGRSREEWKGTVETNKILGLKGQKQVIVDGTCVRVGVMRCHSQSLLVKLKSLVPISEIEQFLTEGNPWVKLVPNNKEATIKYLNPVAVSEKLDIMVGRVRKAQLGGDYLRLFTVGDQLLWGAAEPIRRALKLIMAEM